MNQEWKDEELAFLRRHYETRGAKWVANRLGRSQHAVQTRANKIGLKRRMRGDSLCWGCGKFATGSKEKCPWKWDGIPISGWITKPGVYGGTVVLDCPEFEEWKR